MDKITGNKISKRDAIIVPGTLIVLSCKVLFIYNNLIEK